LTRPEHKAAGSDDRDGPSRAFLVNLMTPPAAAGKICVNRLAGTSATIAEDATASATIATHAAFLSKKPARRSNR
jgi:hypothetical protein